MRTLLLALLLTVTWLLPAATTYPEHVSTDAQRQAWDTGWPCWRGPYGCGAAIDVGYELVKNIDDAQHLWTSADAIPAPQGRLFSGYTSPVVAAGRVFLFYHQGNRRVVEAAIKEHWDSRKPVKDPFAENAGSVTADCVVHCFDAMSGKTIWRQVVGESYAKNKRTGAGKAGGHYTVCVSGDRVVALDSMGRVHCLAVGDGDILWQSDVGDMHTALMAQLEKAVAAKKAYFPKGFNAAPQIIDGVVIIRAGKDMFGFNLQSGSQLWKVTVGGGGSRDSTSHTRWIAADGKEFILHEGHQVMLLSPHDGQALWKLPKPGVGGSAVAVGNLLVYTSNGGPAGPLTRGEPGKRGRYMTAYRISVDGAEHLWSTSKAHETHGVKHFRSWTLDANNPRYAYISGANVTVEGDDGSKGWGRFIVDMTNGNIVKTFGDNTVNNAYAYGPILAEGRYFNQAGDIMGADPATSWFSDAKKQLPTDPCISAAYTCGLIYIRSANHMHCYDMRAKR